MSSLDKSQYTKKFKALTANLYALVIKGVSRNRSPKYKDRQSFVDGIKMIGERKKYTYLLSESDLFATETHKGMFCAGVKFPEFHSDPILLEKSSIITIYIGKESVKLTIDEYKERISMLSDFIQYYKRSSSRNMERVDPNIAFEFFSYVFFFFGEALDIHNLIFDSTIDFESYGEARQEYRTLKHTINKDKRKSKKQMPKAPPQVSINNKLIKELKARIEELERENANLLHNARNPETLSCEASIPEALSKLQLLATDINKHSWVRKKLTQSDTTAEIASKLLAY